MILLAVIPSGAPRVVASAVIAAVFGILWFSFFWRMGERRGFWKSGRMADRFFSLMIASVGAGVFGYIAASSLIADPRGTIDSVVSFAGTAFAALFEWRRGTSELVDFTWAYVIQMVFVVALLSLSITLTARHIKQMKPVADKVEEGMARIEAEAQLAQRASDAPAASASPPVTTVSAGAAVERPDPEPYYGSVCAICQSDVERGDDFVVCRDCSAVYHWVCARDQDGCSKQGCDSEIWMFPTKTVRRWHDVISPAGRLFGEKCGVCREIIEPYDDIAVCVECSAGYHLPCLRGRSVCPNQGCASFAYVYPEGKVKSWRELG